MISGGFCKFVGGFPVITLFHTNQFVLVDINHEYMILKERKRGKKRKCTVCMLCQYITV